MSNSSTPRMIVVGTDVQGNEWVWTEGDGATTSVVAFGRGRTRDELAARWPELRIDKDAV